MKIQRIVFDNSFDTISDALKAVAEYLDIDDPYFLSYLEECEDLKGRGGNHTMGSVHDAESSVLYCIIRAWKCERVVELGTFNGRSTNFLAAAVRNNGMGHVVSLDSRKDAHFAALVEDRNGLTLLSGTNALQYTPTMEPVEFIFEDTDHRTVTHELIPILKEKVGLGGVLISHDVGIRGMDYQVIEAYKDAGIFDESFICQIRKLPGLILWRRNV